MKEGERKKLYVIGQVIERKIRQWKAAEILGICVRQVRRLIKRVSDQGDSGVVHRGRGKESQRKIAGQLKKRVIKLCRGLYQQYGPTLLSEKLLEDHRIRISKETLRKWMLAEGVEYRRRGKRPHRSWRARKPHCGEMVQVDGSHHDWFEGRGPKAVLMAFIDDATGRVFARFYEYEGTMPALDSLKRYIRQYGIPCSLYLDRHTTYKAIRELTVEEELQGLPEPSSHFKRAAEQLGIKVIHAYSPQAKGRIERLFGTLQDRLVKEMRLRGISSNEAADEFLEEYLPKFNSKFQVPAAETRDMHRPIGRNQDLDWILSRQETRVLRNDSTIFYAPHTFQVMNNIRGKRVVIQEATDGRIRLTYRSRRLDFKEVPGIIRRPKQQPAEPVEHAFGIPPKPGPKHPWRKFRVYSDPVYRRP